MSLRKSSFWRRFIFWRSSRTTNLAVPAVSVGVGVGEPTPDEGELELLDHEERPRYFGGGPLISSNG